MCLFIGYYDSFEANRLSWFRLWYSNPKGHLIESCFTETALSLSLELEACFLFGYVSNSIVFKRAVLSLKWTINGNE